MTQATSVHSNAFNFMSFLQNGVDPRTGQYTVSITLPDVKANGLRGPGLPLVLNYNPFNREDSGFGMGWNLQLSQFTPGSQVLSLSSGETFKVTSIDGNRLLMSEQKLDTFHFYKDSATHYRVMHKSGLVEILTTPDSEGVGVALPTRLFASQGHSLTLGYKPFSSTQRMLEWVKDDAGQQLLTLARNGPAVEVALSAADGQSVNFVMTLGGSENRVMRITLPTENAASWRFDYSLFDGHPYIISVDTPTGGHEKITYQDNGLIFPVSSGRVPLPRVTGHLIQPGFAQPDIDVRYTYGNVDNPVHNFLGAGLDVSWADDGLDNLYKHIGNYDYVTTETLWVDEQPKRSIERTFNQFHLLTLETTVQNNTAQEVETTYGIEIGKPFEQQRNDCQLPKDVINRWYLLDNITLNRHQTVSSSYDDSGNLLMQVQANGIVETTTWYPAAGADGCPADPQGFVRQLKDKTVTPATSEYGLAPTLVTRYRYKALPAIDDSDLSDWLTVESETLVQVDIDTEHELQLTVFEHIDTPADAFQHGRIRRQTETLGTKATTTEYVYSTQVSPEFGESVQRTVQTLSGFDAVQKVVTLEHSLLTGEPLLSRDDNDVEIRYRYDNLRRLLCETVAPDTEFEAFRRYEYTLCAKAGDQAEQWMFDVKQVKTSTYFDGLNRAIYEERDDADNPARASELRPTYLASYDSFGNLAHETVYDWLEDQKLDLTSTFEYDDWGEQRCITGPDGVKTFEQTDPIGTAESKGPILRRWTEGTGSPVAKSGVSETWLNLFEKPTQTVRLDLQDVQISLSKNHYDGLGRTVEQTVGVGDEQRKTLNVYDAFDRIIETTLPGNAIVRRTYAVHSREDLPTSISVDHNGKKVELGTQEFDGLGRMINSTTGGRLREFSYEPGQTQPKTVTTPGKKVITYDYTPQLGSEPQQRHLPDSVSATYEYDPHNARLLVCQEQSETLTRTYFSTGELKSEQRLTGGLEYTMQYRYSRLGRLLSYIDVLGQEQTYEYDPQGRLVQTSLGSTASTFTYDALGRSASILTHDNASGNYLSIALTYDAFDRETVRHFNLNGIEQTLTQVYDDVDNLTQRKLVEGAVILRDESYNYDRRGRLTQYNCAGPQSPVDPDGNRITEQVFTLDGIDNVILMLTSYPEGSYMNIYEYSGEDPTQLCRVANSETGLVTELNYDLDGNLILDEAGRSLTYDALGRLIEVSSAKPAVKNGAFSSLFIWLSGVADSNIPVLSLLAKAVLKLFKILKSRLY